MKIDDLVKNPRAWKELAATTKERKAQLAAFKEQELGVAGGFLATDIWQRLQTMELSKVVEFLVHLVEPNRVCASYVGGNAGCEIARRELGVLFGESTVGYCYADMEAVAESCIAELHVLLSSRLKRSQFKVSSNHGVRNSVSIKVFFT